MLRKLLKNVSLKKNAAAQASWSPSIPQRVDALNTIVKFSGDMPEMKLYEKCSRFCRRISVLIPYQFDLFGKGIDAVRLFSSPRQNSSRRALNAEYVSEHFQESKRGRRHSGSIQCSTKGWRDLLTTKRRLLLPMRVNRNNHLNPNHEENCFEVEVLKVLFMVKNARVQRPTVQNIATLSAPGWTRTATS